MHFSAADGVSAILAITKKTEVLTNWEQIIKLASGQWLIGSFKATVQVCRMSKFKYG